jgi:NAD(P)H dehydrogenase (quinone)
MTNNASTAPTLLVTGASGHLGRRVIELLLERNAAHIVAATRTPEKLADFAQRGVEVRYADFDDPQSLTQAFAGVERVLLISTDAIDRPGRRIVQHTAAVKAAEAAGVRHVVYTSIANPTPQNPAFVVPDHSATEAALEASTLGYTVLRNNIYMETLLSAISQALQLGALYSAAGDGKAGYVTREDCAIVAAAALLAPFEGRRYLTVTGPTAVSQAEVAALATQLSGKAIAYVPITLDALIKNMIAAGLPEPVAAAYSSFDAAIAQGQLDGVTDVVETLGGHKPISVADFITQHWTAVAQPQ